MKTNQLLLGAGLLVAGFAAYKYFSTPAAPPQAGYGATYIPAGGSANGFVNTTQAPVWVTATGLALNAAGQILATLNAAGVFQQQQGLQGFWCYDCDPQGVTFVTSCPAGKQCVPYS